MPLPKLKSKRSHKKSTFSNRGTLTSLQNYSLRTPNLINKAHFQLAFKKIIISYARAICTFASSPFSLPYLEQINRKYEINIPVFQCYIRKQRAHLGNLNRIKAFLAISPEDEELLVKYKRVLIELSMVFVRNYFINWSFEGEMYSRQSQIKMRFKVLRIMENV